MRPSGLLLATAACQQCCGAQREHADARWFGDGADADAASVTQAASREEDATLVDEIHVDDRGVVIDVHLAVVVEVTIGPARETTGKARIGFDVVVDVDL